MTEVVVRAEPTAEGWRCAVTVRSGGTTTDHVVRVTRSDLDRLAPGAADPSDLVRRSFDFLLAREPATSILRSFDLPVIGRYFPEFEREIRSQG